MAFPDFTKADWTVVRALAEHEGGMDRAALARSTGLSPATLSAVINRLHRRGLIDRTRTALGVGRPAETVALCPERPVVVGVNMAEGRLDLALAGLDGMLKRRRRHSIDHHAPWETASLIRKTIREWARSRERPERIAGVFIALQLDLKPASPSAPKSLKIFAERTSWALGRPVRVMTMPSAIAGHEHWDDGGPPAQPCLSVWLGPEIEARILDGTQERPVSSKAGGDVPPGTRRTAKTLVREGLNTPDLSDEHLKRAMAILAWNDERVSDWIARAGVHGGPGPVASILIGGIGEERVRSIHAQVETGLEREGARGAEPPPVTAVCWDAEMSGLLPARAGLARAGLFPNSPA